MSIQPKDYNNARAALARAGSKNAHRTIRKDAKGRNFSDSDGKQLLFEAIADFQEGAVGSLTNGMTIEHNTILSNAARTMGFDIDYVIEDYVIADLPVI